MAMIERATADTVLQISRGYTNNGYPDGGGMATIKRATADTIQIRWAEAGPKAQGVSDPARTAPLSFFFFTSPRARGGP